MQDHQKAITCFEQAIQVGGDNGGSRLTSLGAALFEVGRVEESIATLKKALEIGEKKYGKVHPDVATTLSQLGDVYQKLQDYKNAQFYFKQELHVNQVLYGFWHESNITRWRCLANVAEENGVYIEELIYLRSALEVALKCFGSKSLELKHIYLKICVAEKRLKNHAASIEAAEQAVSLYIAHHGKKGKEYGAMLSYLLLAVRDTDPKRGVSVALEGLNNARENEPSPSETEGMSLLNLGGLYRLIGDKEQAILYYKKCHEVFFQVFGLSHPQTQKALQRLRELDPQETKDMDDHSQGLENLMKAFLNLPASSLPGLPQQSSLTPAEELQIRLQLNKARLAFDPQFNLGPQHAISELTQLINKFPADPRGYFELGDIYKEYKMFEAAQKLFNRLLRYAPENANAHYQMGLVLSLDNQGQKAHLYLKKCIELEPNHEEALQLLTEVNEKAPLQEKVLVEEDITTRTHNSADSGDTFYQLYQEIKEGKVAKLQELYPFDLKQSDERGQTLLHYATMCENFDAMVFLCEKGADVNIVDKEGISPISYVCAPDQMRFFDYLLTRGARLDFQRKKNGFNCFHQCVFKGNTEAVSSMLERKTFAADLMTGEGISPLYLACQGGGM